MGMSLTIEKQEITNWINRLEDKSVIDRIYQFMKDFEKPRYDAVYAATLSDDERIAYWRKVGYTAEESKQRLLERIKEWQWTERK